MVMETSEPRHRNIGNPGTFININDRCTNVFPRCFDGFRVIVHRNLSKHFRVIHNIYLSSITPGNYRFGVVYQGKQDDPGASSVIFGDIDCRGNMNANLYRYFGPKFKISFDSQMQYGSFLTSQLATHYYGDTFTASAIVMNVDFMKKSGGVLLHYLQSVSPNLAFGAELACMRNLMVDNVRQIDQHSLASQVSIVGRYSTPYSTWSANVSPTNFLLSCYKRTSDQVEFGFDVDTNFRTNISVGSIGYKISLLQRGILFKGLVDTNTNVGSVFEKRLCGTPFSFAVSANLNHKTSNFRLGLGVIIE